MNSTITHYVDLREKAFLWLPHVYSAYADLVLSPEGHKLDDAYKKELSADHYMALKWLTAHLFNRADEEAERWFKFCEEEEKNS